MVKEAKGGGRLERDGGFLTLFRQGHMKRIKQRKQNKDILLKNAMYLQHNQNCTSVPYFTRIKWSVSALPLHSAGSQWFRCVTLSSIVVYD